MEIDLSKIGMEKGMQYETIITTSDCEGNLNAAPIGILCKGNENIMCRIFKGGRTVNNIISQKEFVVNISQNPLLFTRSLLYGLEDEQFNEDKSIKGIDCYFKCEVINLKEGTNKSGAINRKSETVVINAKVTQLVINNPIQAYNRSFGYVVESLANISRIDIVDDEKKKYYFNSFREAYRITKKVGSKKEKQSMDKIKSKLIEKGFEP